MAALKRCLLLAAGVILLLGGLATAADGSATNSATDSTQASERVPDSVAGDWQIVLHAPGDPRQMHGYFAVDGTELTGYLSSEEGRTDFTGQVDGSQLVFDVKVRKPIRLTLKYQLQVTGDVLSGRCKMGWFGTADVTGARVQAAAR